MKKSFFFLVILLFCTASMLSAQRECAKKYRISGPKSDGSGTYMTEYTLFQKCYEYSSEEIQKCLDDEAKEYKGFDYKLINMPSQKQTCAGLGFERLFGKGPYCTNADAFCDEIIYKFGKLVYEEKTIPGLTWGDVQPGDVAIYFKNNKPLHVTVVNSIEKTLGATTKIVIETKCDKQGTYLHPLGLIGYMNDPLARNYGKLKIFHVDVSKLEIEDISIPCECKIFTLRVMVLNAEDNLPLKNSNVDLKMRNEYEGKLVYGSGITDEKGEVKFRDVPLEIMQNQPFIAAVKDGFKEKWSDLNQEFIEKHLGEEAIFTVYLSPENYSYILKEVATDTYKKEGNVITKTEFSIDYSKWDASRKDKLKFVITKAPPPGINPGDEFTVSVSAQSQNPGLDYVFGPYWKCECNLPTGLYVKPQNVRIGRVFDGTNYTGDVINSAEENFVIKVPEFNSSQISLHFKIYFGVGASSYYWMDYIYEKK